MTDPATFTARLLAHGRLAWTDLLMLADGLPCAWADHDGWHTGDCPDTAPAYTHLWGWSPDRLLRVRIDGAEAVVAELAPAGASGQDVPVRVLYPEPEPWAETLLGGNLVFARTETTTPIGFAAFGEAATSWAGYADGGAV